MSYSSTPLVRPEKTHLFALAWSITRWGRPGAFAHTQPTLLHRSPSRITTRRGMSRAAPFRLFGYYPGLRGEASPGMNWGVGFLKSRFLNGQHHVTNHSTGPGSLSLWDFICSLSFFSFCCLIVMSSKSLLLTKSIIPLRHQILLCSSNLSFQHLYESFITSV
jgi:hypothetical protein